MQIYNYLCEDMAVSLLQISDGKKKIGKNAMYYAITQGKFELISWLVKQKNPIAGQSFGDFMEKVMLELTVIEDKHVQAINHFVSAQVKIAESEGKIILMNHYLIKSNIFKNLIVILNQLFFYNEDDRAKQILFR